MTKEVIRKVQTDADVRRKAVKLVVSHLRKKIPQDFIGSENIIEWLSNMEKLLEKDEFVLKEYMEMRKSLNDIIERTIDEELRFKLRDSWLSLGKALSKKPPQ